MSGVDRSLPDRATEADAPDTVDAVDTVDTVDTSLQFTPA
jgi:hypothetical protein